MKKLSNVKCISSLQFYILDPYHGKYVAREAWGLGTPALSPENDDDDATTPKLMIVVIMLFAPINLHRCHIFHLGHYGRETSLSV